MLHSAALSHCQWDPTLLLRGCPSVGGQNKEIDATACILTSKIRLSNTESDYSTGGHEEMLHFRYT